MLRLVPALAVTVDTGVRVISCAAVRTIGTDAAASAWPNAGVFVSIEATEVLPVVCRADVDAPVGRGSEATDTGCVTAEPSTFNATIEAMP